MSVYNGFGTRKLEYQYSKALFGLLLVLQTKLISSLPMSALSFWDS
jgi:hypothetical protein